MRIGDQGLLFMPFGNYATGPGTPPASAAFYPAGGLDGLALANVVFPFDVTIEGFGLYMIAPAVAGAGGATRIEYVVLKDSTAGLTHGVGVELTARVFLKNLSVAPVFLRAAGPARGSVKNTLTLVKAYTAISLVYNEFGAIGAGGDVAQFRPLGMFYRIQPNPKNLFG